MLPTARGPMNPKSLLLLVLTSVAVPFLLGCHLTLWVYSWQIAVIPALDIALAVAVITAAAAVALLGRRCLSLHRQGCLLWGAT